MEGINYRKYKEEDIPQLAELFAQVFGVYSALSHHAKEYAIQYVVYCLSHSSFTYVAEKEKEIVGFAIARIDKYFKEDEKIINKLKEIRKDLSNYSDIVQTMNTLDNYYKVEEEILNSSNIKREAELILFVTKKSCQGKGVGKAIIGLLEKEFKEAQLETYYVTTDTTCNYNVYEHLNFRLVGRRNSFFNFVKGTIPIVEMIFLKTL